MNNKVKCFSVRLESLNSISEKCYKATAFDGTTALIPKSQVFGRDYDVEKSDAYWISTWILEQKELQYSSKKVSFFDKSKAEFIADNGVTVEVHIPDVKDPIEVEPINELVKEKMIEFRHVNEDGIIYDFKSKNFETAILFAKNKFNNTFKILEFVQILESKELTQNYQGYTYKVKKQNGDVVWVLDTIFEENYATA